jgi:hypothetical protein
MQLQMHQSAIAMQELEEKYLFSSISKKQKNKKNKKTKTRKKKNTKKRKNEKWIDN